MNAIVSIMRDDLLGENMNTAPHTMLQSIKLTKNCLLAAWAHYFSHCKTDH
ncbi:hypothetical protein XBO1_280013 [Xenorhabdus bovienii str. oregonense]|uniref:Uncharacterized protein n=1 Tax=Xenorhabdus bovienii str. oregonense TaxID=1398202 RepID=A0A077P987_XENBV|nr:hypothetical protein XBO1_280013 [Xenorhabdus bovienii str. oregonense]